MKKILAMALMAVFGSSAVSATVITDRTAFLNLSGTITEHADLFADFTISAPSGSSTVAPGSTGTFTDFFTGNSVILSGVENFNAVVTFATSIYAFGMDVYEPTDPAIFNGCNVSTCLESTFGISFLAGTTLLDTITFEPDNDMLDFIGYSSATAFDRIEIRETVGGNDNEMFGNFVSLTNPVPSPGSLPLVIAGLLGALGLVHRKSRA